MFKRVPKRTLKAGRKIPRERLSTVTSDGRWTDMQEAIITIIIKTTYWERKWSGA